MTAVARLCRLLRCPSPFPRHARPDSHHRWRAQTSGYALPRLGTWFSPRLVLLFEIDVRYSRLGPYRINRTITYGSPRRGCFAGASFGVVGPGTCARTLRQPDLTPDLDRPVLRNSRFSVCVRSVVDRLEVATATSVVVEIVRKLPDKVGSQVLPRPWARSRQSGIPTRDGVKGDAQPARFAAGGPLSRVANRTVRCPPT
jgi:hypothetical protein